MKFSQTRISTLLHRGVTTKSDTVYCLTCGNVTRESKPYCPDHIENLDYVQNLLDIIKNKEKHEKKIERYGMPYVDPNSLTFSEVINYLRVHGARTSRRIARETQLEYPLIAHILAYMSLNNYVNLSLTQRGDVKALLHNETISGYAYQAPKKSHNRECWVFMPNGNRCKGIRRKSLRTCFSHRKQESIIEERTQQIPYKTLFVQMELKKREQERLRIKNENKFSDEVNSEKTDITKSDAERYALCGVA